MELIIGFIVGIVVGGLIAGLNEVIFKNCL